MTALGPSLLIQSGATPSAPEWVHLLPPGSFYGRDGRGPYHLDNPEALIAATRALGMDVLIDRDHATDLGGPGDAVLAEGWIEDLEMRAGGLWGRVAWTARGTEVVTARLYRYLSPVFEINEAGVILRLLRVSLTNNPNLHLTALNARGRNTHGVDMDIKDLTALLELPDTAGPSAVLSHIKALMARTASPDPAPPDPALYVPMAQYSEVSQALTALQSQVQAATVETILTDARNARKVTAANEVWAKAYAQKDAQGFGEWLAIAPVIAPEPGSLVNGKPPAASDQPLTAAEQVVARQLGLSAEQIIQSRESK